MMDQNPFFYGNSVSNSRFFDRRGPLRRVVGRLINGGQSSAIVGEPRLGKTSLLNYIAAPEMRSKLYGDWGDRMLFSFVDSQMLPRKFTAAQFWERVLLPVKTRLVDPVAETALAQQYGICQENEFGTFTLETLFRQLQAADWRFVLLMDEFDGLLHHEVLNSVEFFGGLRSLASRSGGSLALVIASRQPIHLLNHQTQSLNSTGSPFFNIFAEVTLGPFPHKDVEALLALAGQRFTARDKRAVSAIAGRHPYLLQVAATALWDAYEEDLATPQERWAWACDRIYQEGKNHFKDTWRVWSPATRKAFTTVGLCCTAQLLPERSFLLDAFVKGLIDLGPELKDLAAVGAIAADDTIDGGWRVEPQVMLWWLADELIQVVRDDKPFDQWLQAQELEHLLTRQERDSLTQFVRGAAEILQQGASKLVEAFAAGLGKRLTGGA